MLVPDEDDMRPSTPACLLALTAGISVGCSTESPDGSNTGGLAGTGAVLSVDLTGNTDVVGYAFQVQRVGCTPAQTVSPWSKLFLVNLVDGYFPGDISIVEQRLDEEARHLGANLFVSLEEGCYDLTASLARSIDPPDWGASEQCAPAYATEVLVQDGETTDVTLISQCNG